MTGPTGSGKSTTLYAALGEINTPEKNIITIEDPVEYQVAGVTQVQVNPKAGLTFATGLRAMMRADPDIIMVGEIRDRETAQIAVEAALTGHLVLSTLHTNDAADRDHPPHRDGHRAVPRRQRDRLRRRPAPRPHAVPALQGAHDPARVASLRDHGFQTGYDLEAYEPVGCARCGGSGYKGRIGLYEVMPVTEEIRDARDRARVGRPRSPRSRCATACAACATTASTRSRHGGPRSPRSRASRARAAEDRGLALAVFSD